MAEPDDLLGKADALMARHRPVLPAAEPHAEIPVLHEVVDRGHGHDDLPLLTELAVIPKLDEQQTEALKQSLCASLLAELQPAIDQLIEGRLKEGLGPLVETMFNDLRGDLRHTAHRLLSEAINRAVEQEIDRRRLG